MRCPFCAFVESKVIDSRPTDEGQRIRRRRECLACQKRFTTFEMIDSINRIYEQERLPNMLAVLNGVNAKELNCSF